VLHLAGEGAYGDRLTHRVLVLDQNDQTKDIIFDQRLGSQRKRQAQHPQAGDQRSDVDPQSRKQADQGHYDDHNPEAVDKHPHHGLQPPAPANIPAIGVITLFQAAQNPPLAHTDQAQRQPGQQQDRQEVEQAVQPPHE